MIRNRMGKLWVAGLLVGFIFGLVNVGVVALPSANQSSWDLPVLGGGRQSLSSLRGNVVVASFGATWCPPCRAELPALQALADKYRGKDVKVVWISIDDKKVSDQELAQFVQQLGLRVPVLRDLSGSAFSQFGQPSVPMMVVIDKQGHLVGKPHLGFFDKETYIQTMSGVIDSVL